jgi:hypothetical protein
LAPKLLHVTVPTGRDVGQAGENCLLSATCYGSVIERMRIKADCN